MRTRRVDFLFHSLVIARIDDLIFLNAYSIGIGAEASHRERSIDVRAILWCACCLIRKATMIDKQMVLFISYKSFVYAK